jgi:hypothetical protein
MYNSHGKQCHVPTEKFISKNLHKITEWSSQVTPLNLLEAPHLLLIKDEGSDSYCAMTFVSGNWDWIPSHHDCCIFWISVSTEYNIDEELDDHHRGRYPIE